MATPAPTAAAPAAIDGRDPLRHGRYRHPGRSSARRAIGSLPTSAAAGARRTRPRTEPARGAPPEPPLGNSRARRPGVPLPCRRTRVRSRSAEGSAGHRPRSTPPSHVRCTVAIRALGAGPAGETRCVTSAEPAPGHEPGLERPGDRLRRRRCRRQRGREADAPDAGRRDAGVPVRQPLRHRQQWPVGQGADPRLRSGRSTPLPTMSRAAPRPRPAPRVRLPRRGGPAAGRPSGADTARCTAVDAAPSGPPRRPRGPGGPGGRGGSRRRSRRWPSRSASRREAARRIGSQRAGRRADPSNGAVPGLGGASADPTDVPRPNGHGERSGRGIGRPARRAGSAGNDRATPEDGRPSGRSRTAARQPSDRRAARHCAGWACGDDHRRHQRFG